MKEASPDKPGGAYICRARLTAHGLPSRDVANPHTYTAWRWPMPRAQRICGRPGCPKPVAKRYCIQHDAEYEAKRGTKKERGYGADFWAMRRQWEPKVASGDVNCWRCKQPIDPLQTWHLGHNDDNRNIIEGPEHPRCNLRAAGQASHKYD